MSGSWRLRGYVVGQRLGGGASSEVWRGRVAPGGATVALKRIALDTGDVGEQRRRADAEAALLSALDHAHLVRLHAVVPVDDALVLVLDLAEGGSLADLLRARGRLTPGEVITAIAPVGAALAYLHDEGVVHGDVSAANILFTAGGSPLLTDVGVARLTGDDRDAASTPAYIDPSVACGCIPGPQSDVFMLAAVALHALTGAPPWPAADGASAVEQAAHGDLGDVTQRLAAADVPPAMTRVLLRALSVDPQRRGTAADLALDLRHSGEPTAVELLAGRRGSDPAPGEPTGPRHAAVAARPDVARVRAAAGGRRGRFARGHAARSPDPGRLDPGRPEFERPAGPSGAGQRPSAPPTRLVGQRPRPVMPPRRARPSVRALVIAFTVLVSAGVAATGTVWAATRQAAAPQGSHAPAAHRPAVRPSSPRSTSPTSAPRAEPGASVTARTTTVLAALDDLDRVRARAYAERDAGLLARVYGSRALLLADTRQLQRSVPAGCGLKGVRTSYRSAHMVSAAGSHVVLTVTATLAPSALMCHGVQRSAAAGTPPTGLRLELTRAGGRFRISAQRAA